MLAGGVGIEGGSSLLEEASALGTDRSDSSSRASVLNALGALERELERHRGAARVADDMCARDAEVVEERRGVGRVVGDADRRRCVRAPRPAALVIRDQPVAGGQRGL